MTDWLTRFSSKAFKPIEAPRSPLLHCALCTRVKLLQAAKIPVVQRVNINNMWPIFCLFHDEKKCMNSPKKPNETSDVFTLWVPTVSRDLIPARVVLNLSAFWRLRYFIYVQWVWDTFTTASNTDFLDWIRRMFYQCLALKCTTANDLNILFDKIRCKRNV